MSRVDDAHLHLNWAREAERNRDFLRARVEYLKAVESIKQANAAGQYNNEFNEITSEYHNFVKRDPIYSDLVKRLLPLISATPGILQSDVPKQAPQLTREDISYTLYFAALFGVISRTKKGRSYELKVI